MKEGTGLDQYDGLESQRLTRWQGRQSAIAQTREVAVPWLQGLGNAVLDLVFPPRCVACYRLGTWFCASCADEVEAICPPICRRCGLPLDASRPRAGSTCQRCLRSPPRLDGLRSYAFHSGPLREAIRYFEYEDTRVLAKPLGDLLSQGWLNPSIGVQDIDLIVPVPLHPRRERERGFNQAALLARRMGANLGLSVADGVLKRTKQTRPQVGLSAQERRRNVDNAFQCVGPVLTGTQVLLVDDVCTSGSTLEAACRALREGGASFVWASTLARARIDASAA